MVGSQYMLLLKVPEHVSCLSNHLEFANVHNTSVGQMLETGTDPGGYQGDS